MSVYNSYMLTTKSLTLDATYRYFKKIRQNIKFLYLAEIVTDHKIYTTASYIAIVAAGLSDDEIVQS